LLENSIFTVLALFLVGGALGLISARRTVVSAISFLLAMVAMAGMFALLHNSFLFLAQLLVSVGAVVTLSLLVILSVNIPEESLQEKGKLQAMAVASILVLPIGALMFKTVLDTPMSFAQTGEDFGTLESIGKSLFSDWVLPFELISILLLVALVAAVVISRKRSRYDA